MYIDTHCHIHDPEYHLDSEETLARARYVGVEKVVVIGTSPRNSDLACAFAEAHEGFYWSYGCHPGELQLPSEEQNLASSGFGGRYACAPVAIGEIGLDYHYPGYDREAQIRLLERMLQLAVDQSSPCIFHVREAFADFWPIIGNFRLKPSVLHSFSDTQENLSRAIKEGFVIGVNGLATFAKIPLPPLENMVLETDAPYLTPALFRGKINEPAYIPSVAAYIAQQLGVTLEKVAETTTQNAKRLFHI